MSIQVRSKCLKKISIPNSNKIKIFDWYFWTIILSNTSFLLMIQQLSILLIENQKHLPTKKNKKIMLKILNKKCKLKN